MTEDTAKVAAGRDLPPREPAADARRLLSIDGVVKHFGEFRPVDKP